MWVCCVCPNFDSFTNRITVCTLECCARRKTEKNVSWTLHLSSLPFFCKQNHGIHTFSVSGERSMRMVRASWTPLRTETWCAHTGEEGWESFVDTPSTWLQFPGGRKHSVLTVNMQPPGRQRKKTDANGWWTHTQSVTLAPLMTKEDGCERLVDTPNLSVTLAPLMTPPSGRTYSYYLRPEAATGAWWIGRCHDWLTLGETIP